MKHRTLKFPAWKDPDGPTHEMVITFHNDGQFTTNSINFHKIPQNEDVFDKTIDTYISSGEAVELDLHKLN